MKRLLALALVALPASTVPAQTLDCENAISTVEMTGCASQAYDAADADLNAAYRLAMTMAKRLDDGQDWTPTNEQMLRDAQRTWITFRDQACAAESTLFRGGTGQNLLALSCLERLTRQRTEDLRLYGETN